MRKKKILSARLPAHDHFKIRMYCIKNGISVQKFVEKIIKPYLRKK